jgi:hypothetical protein
VREVRSEYRINVVSQNGFPPVSDPDGLVVFDGVNFVDSSHTAVVYVTEDNNGPFNFGYACDVEEPEYQGCTPGYWRNHTKAWSVTGYATSTPVGNVFVGSLFGNSTLIQAIKFGGGGGISGAQKILLRASVAALLNAADPAVTYPLKVSQVISLVNTALASGNRDVILTLATDLDVLNNAGCPK